MIRKSLLMFLSIAVIGGAALAQTPQPKSQPQPQVFSWSFDGDGGYLGVQTEEVTRENVSKFGLREVRGVGVAKVVENSPAEKAGLQNGDVIVKVNDEEISSGRKLTRLIGEISPDHTARVTVVRGGSEREFDVTLGKRPMANWGDGAFAFPEKLEKFDMPDMPELGKLPKFEMGKPGQPYTFSFSNRRQIGVGLTPLTKQLSDHFGVANGVLINDVRENSPAAKAGLKAGDIIVEVEGKAVKSEWDVIRALGEKKEGDLSITFVRDGNRETVRVTPEEVKGFEQFFKFEGTPGAPDAPDAPGVFKLMKPGTPMAPVPLNQLIMPGRVI